VQPVSLFEARGVPEEDKYTYLVSPMNPIDRFDIELMLEEARAKANEYLMSIGYHQKNSPALTVATANLKIAIIDEVLYRVEQDGVDTVISEVQKEIEDEKAKNDTNSVEYLNDELVILNRIKEIGLDLAKEDLNQKLRDLEKVRYKGNIEYTRFVVEYKKNIDRVALLQVLSRCVKVKGMKYLDANDEVAVLNGDLKEEYLQLITSEELFWLQEEVAKASNLNYNEVLGL
jgi:hypothetical protein